MSDALLAAIIRAPDDDTVRLAYADWLEENGKGGKERGGFIRFQLDYAYHARLDDTGDRFVEWEDEADVWPYQSWPDSAETLFGGNDPKSRGLSFRWRRGFIDRVECRLVDWQAHGPAVVRAHPVVTVRVTDREPYTDAVYHHRTDATHHHWYDEREVFQSLPGTHPESDLPGDVYDALTGGERIGQFRFYPTSESAFADLSQALLAWAKARPA